MWIFRKLGNIQGFKSIAYILQIKRNSMSTLKKCNKVYSHVTRKPWINQKHF